VIEAKVKGGRGDRVDLLARALPGRRDDAGREGTWLADSPRARKDVGGAGPLVHMGDFNVKAGSPEHQAMQRALRLNEVATGDTYVEPNLFQDKLQAPRAEDTRGRGSTTSITETTCWCSRPKSFGTRSSRGTAGSASPTTPACGPVSFTAPPPPFRREFRPVRDPLPLFWNRSPPLSDPAPDGNPWFLRRTSCPHSRSCRRSWPSPS
jgi:hypothetical protein